MTKHKKKGNSREYAVRDKLKALRYFVCRSPGSLGAQDLFAETLDLDSTLPKVAIQVGGADKSVKESFKKLLAVEYPPGTVFLVARCERRVWRYYIGLENGVLYTDLRRAIEAAAEENR